MNPNFQQTKVVQSNAIRGLQQENDYLRAQAQAMAQTSRLIEAAVTGLASRLDDPAEIATKAIEIAGAVIIGLDKLSSSDQA